MISRTLNGFTLIECLLYIGLFSLVLQGIVLSFFTFARTSSRAQEEAHLSNEGAFVLQTLAYEAPADVQPADIQALVDPADAVTAFSWATSTDGISASMSVSFTLASRDRSGSLVRMPFSGSWAIPPP